MGHGHDQFCFILKDTRELAKNVLKTFFYPGERLNFPEKLRNFAAETFLLRIPEFTEKFAKFWSEDLFSFSFFLRSLPRCVFGLSPWHREGLFLEGLFFALALNFFCVSLTLASSLLSSAPPLFITMKF